MRRTPPRAPAVVPVAAVLAAAVLTLAGCTPRDDVPVPPVSTGTSEAGPDPTGVPTATAAPSDGPAKTDCATDLDLAGVTWTWPAGFSESSAFAQVVPLGEQVLARYAVPDGDRGRDVLGVIVYDQVPAPDATVDPDRITCRRAAAATIETINEALDVTVLAGPTDIELAGQPALREDVSQPGGFTYHAIWLVAGDQILHITCQYDEQPEVITAACDELLASVALP